MTSASMVKTFCAFQETSGDVAVAICHRRHLKTAKCPLAGTLPLGVRQGRKGEGALKPEYSCYTKGVICWSHSSMIPSYACLGSGVKKSISLSSTWVYLRAYLLVTVSNVILSNFQTNLPWRLEDPLVGYIFLNGYAKPIRMPKEICSYYVSAFHYASFMTKWAALYLYELHLIRPGSGCVWIVSLVVPQSGSAVQVDKPWCILQTHTGSVWKTTVESTVSYPTLAWQVF